MSVITSWISHTRLITLLKRARPHVYLDGKERITNISRDTQLNINHRTSADISLMAVLQCLFPKSDSFPDIFPG